MNLLRWWRKRQRMIDRRVFFPILKEKAASPRAYEEAMLVHASIDPAWRFPEEWEHENMATGYFTVCGPHCDH